VDEVWRSETPRTCDCPKHHSSLLGQICVYLPSGGPEKIYFNGPGVVSFGRRTDEEVRLICYLAL
jgi:hypothetical protein